VYFFALVLFTFEFVSPDFDRCLDFIAHKCKVAVLGNRNLAWPVLSTDPTRFRKPGCSFEN
jgi:hypothetical protein